MRLIAERCFGQAATSGGACEFGHSPGLQHDLQSECTGPRSPWTSRDRVVFAIFDNCARQLYARMHTSFRNTCRR